jgi:fatty-acyl-CoA synthase
VTHTYGLSEAPTVVTIEDRDGPRVAGAAGRALPHLHVQILDGEVCVGPTATGPWAGAYRTMLGYWERDEATAESLAGGILHTGDLGDLDADGFLSLRDRKSLVILRGGANVYPAEVERVVHEVDGVAACAVMGVPDERLGERVVAAVELLPDAEVTGPQLTAHCLANLAKYKVPERWVFVDTFPRNSMGKIQRRELAPLFDH